MSNHSNVATLDTSLRRNIQQAAENRTDKSLRTSLNRIAYNHADAKLKDKEAEHSGVIQRPDQFKGLHGSTEILCKDIADILMKRYPNWAWAVQPQEFGQLINVYNLHLHDEFGYTIRMVEIMNDPKRKEAYKAGHDILRRYDMPDRFSASRVMEMPRDAKGKGIPHIEDVGTKKQIRDTEIARKLDSGEWKIVEANGKRYLRAMK